MNKCNLCNFHKPMITNSNISFNVCSLSVSKMIKCLNDTSKTNYFKENSFLKEFLIHENEMEI